MSILERLYQIDQILSGRTFVPRQELQEKLGISWATLKRDLAYLKDRLHAPIIFDRDLLTRPLNIRVMRHMLHEDGGSRPG